ncbi:MAG: hypothetical protein ACETWM_17010 [Candidatus Lokiarchaeia archaeon]
MTDFEVVIEDSADKYDILLEAFDRRIKNSKLKKVTREGKSEWNVGGGGWFSKGSILFYQRRNDIICRVIPEKNIFYRCMTVNIFGTWSYALPPRIYSEVVRVIEEVYDDVIGAEEEAQTEILDWCIVCDRIINDDEEITKCPYCYGLAHIDHLLKYIEVKGRCPSCGKELKKYKLV